MKHFVICISLALTPTVAAAEDSSIDRGFSLLEEGTALLLEGLLAEIEPQLEELKSALGELNAYHAPEMLPNGDIIIRRKDPVEIEPPLEEGEIDL